MHVPEPSYAQKGWNPQALSLFGYLYFHIYSMHKTKLYKREKLLFILFIYFIYQINQSFCIYILYIHIHIYLYPFIHLYLYLCIAMCIILLSLSLSERLHYKLITVSASGDRRQGTRNQKWKGDLFFPI